jgi:hypothetical protein
MCQKNKMKNNNRRKKDENEGSNVVHLGTRSNSEEEYRTEHRSEFVDNHAGAFKKLKYLGDKE